MIEKIDYKEIVLNWLIQYYVEKELGNQSIDIHVDQLLNIRSDKRYIEEGIKLYKALIDICKDNNLLNDFIPVFRISLKDTDKIEKYNVKSLDDILKDVNHRRPPEICLYRKVSNLFSRIYEKYEYSLINCYFSSIFKSNYYFYYTFYKNEEDINDNWEYSRMISIEYNENKHNCKSYPNKLVLNENI